MVEIAPTNCNEMHGNHRAKIFMANCPLSQPELKMVAITPNYCNEMRGNRRAKIFVVTLSPVATNFVLLQCSNLVVEYIYLIYISTIPGTH